MGLTELHRHLDASIRASTLAELSGQFRSADEVKARFWLTRQLGSLKEVLDCFVLFQQVLRSPEILERVAREAVEDAAAEGISRIELRYSPSFTSEFSKISWEDSLSAFERGLRAGSAATGVQAGLICIASRGYSVESVQQTIDFAVAHKSRFVGVDLAGPEEGYPCAMYEDAFRKALDAGMPVTIHAGEATGPENVWDAIDLLGARRIGHGIHSIEDKELMRRLARDGILLEVCPTSNIITRSVAEWRAHPLPKLLDAGVPVSINTDDPGIFGVTLGEERERCRRLLGMSEQNLRETEAYASHHSFLPALQATRC